MSRNVLPAALVLMSACAGADNYLVSPALGVGGGRIALLPFDNYSNDVSAPGLIREEVLKRFAGHGYEPLDTPETDEKLRAMGITDGGQLPSVKPEEIGKAVGSGLLCYGTVEDFTFQNIGFVIRKSVRLRIKIVSSGTGETLFEAVGKGRDLKVFLDKDEAKRAFISYSALRLVENMLKHPLGAESEAAIKRVFDRLPRRY
jgi:hypothetical protein